MKSMAITLEFPPAAHALLQSIALEGNHASVEAMIFSLCFKEARAFAQALASEITPELTELFGSPEHAG